MGGLIGTIRRRHLFGGAALVIFAGMLASAAARADLGAGALIASSVPAGFGAAVLLLAAGHWAGRRRLAAAEEARVRSLLDITLESTADGIVMVDLAGQLVGHNARYLEMWGFDRSEGSTDRLCGHTGVLEQLVDPAGFVRRVNELYEAPEESGSDILEFRDGRTLHRTTQPHRLAGRTVGRVWIFRDITVQRRTETALAESERRFRRMVTNVPGVIFQFYVRRDHTLWFTYLSEGCNALLGVQPESFPWRADSLTDRVHVDDMRTLMAAVTRCTVLMEPWSWEGRISLEGAGTRWLRAASRPTRHEDGKVTWDGLLMDVTDEKAAVAALHRREEQLAEAQRIAHIGSWDWDLRAEMVTVSDEHWRIFGHEPQAFPWSYAHYIGSIHSDDRERVRAELERSLTSGAPTALDYRIVRPDGAERFVTSRGKVVRDDAGNPIRMLGTAQDVTERRRSEERFRHLFHHVADAFFLHDPAGNIVAVNRSACETLGYTEGELRELRIGELLDRTSSAGLAAQWTSFTPGESVTMEVVHLRKDGTRFSAEVRTGLFDDGGDEPLIIATARDITEQKQAAAALEKRVRVEQALTRVARLLSASSSGDIGRVLGLIGSAIGADRAYLFRSRAEADVVLMDNTHEWCASGVAPAIDNLQGLDTADAPWWVEQLSTQPSLVVQTLDELPPEAALERRLLEMHDVRATAAVPLMDGRVGLIGFLGFDHVLSARPWSEEDVRVLQTTAEMLVAHFSRRQAEQGVLRREGILQAVNFAAERFLRTREWEAGLDEALALIGGAAGVSRSYLFETRPGEGGAILVGQRAEWVAEGIEPQMPNRGFHFASLTDLGLGRWEQLFRRRESLQGVVSGLPDYEKMCLSSQQIRSVLQIPIYVGDEWWGCLGVDDCVEEREWSPTEVEALGTAAGMIAAAVQRQRSEEALGESEERFRQMAESIGEVFYMVSVETNELIYLSPAYEEVWGRSLSDPATMSTDFIDAILPEDRHILFTDMELSQSGQGETQRVFDYRIVRPDGAIRWIRNRTFQILGEGGRPFRVAGVASDITEQKQLEEELRRANRIEAIGHLAAGIAHEINTPIQYIGDNVRFLDGSYADVRLALDAYRSLLEEAGAGAVSPARVAEIAATVEKADVEYVLREAPRASAQALDGVQRVAEIVKAMKEFSHPGTGQKVPTDLNQAIRSTTTVARNEWKFVAELVTDLDETLPMVACLPGELNQAILNLVVNAAHAIADRQHESGLDEPGLITVTTAAHGEFVEVRVSDTGTGIPDEIRGRVFDPFFTTKEVGRGTGQGLTFVHSIVVEKHGGTVAFETEAGVGTTFVVRLPHGAQASGLSEAA
jgi:PAS domain S-box-containing protein